MNAVQEIPDGKQISVLVQVQKIGERQEVKQALFKQDATLADKTGHIQLTLWQNDIDKLEEGKTYRLQNLIVKSFSGRKYLSTPKAGLSSTLEEDMEDVVCDPDTSSLTEELVAEVVGVADVDTRKGCIKCRSTVDEIDHNTGICSRCSMTQRLDRCPKELVVKLVIRDEEKKLHTLMAFQNQIRKITGDDTIDEVTRADEVTKSLLNSELFTCTYTGGTIKNVDRLVL